jgi:cytochrome c oxidase assembly protein subunit 15
MRNLPLPELALLLAIGVLVASIPLAFVWMARGQDRVRRLAWVVAFLTFDLVVFGGFTRLTDSGLGCPDWPGCFAHASPVGAAPQIHLAEQLLPSGPVTTAKAWIEMIHRALAGGLGVLIIVMLVAAIVQRERPGRSWRLAAAALVLVGVQGLFGALTVTERLTPLIVTSHLILGMALLALLLWHAAQFERNATARDHRAPSEPGLRYLATLAALLLALQIALGGWVSSNYAVLACTDFPLCQGQWLPPADWSDGFTMWHKLGLTSEGQYLPFAALTAIQLAHRALAWLVALVVATLALRCWKDERLARLARLLAGLLVLQFFSGIANVLFGWPLAAGVLHNAGAAALVGTLVMINYTLYSTRPGDSIPADPIAARRAAVPSRSTEIAS